MVMRFRVRQRQNLADRKLLVKIFSDSSSYSLAVEKYLGLTNPPLDR